MIMAGVVQQMEVLKRLMLKCWNIFDAPLKIDDLLFLFTDLSVQGSRVQEGFEAVLFFLSDEMTHPKMVFVNFS